MPTPERFFTGLKGPDPRDERDWKARDRLSHFRAINPNALPERLSLEDTCPIVMDQKTVSGCVGWAGVACYNQNQYTMLGKPKRRPPLLSPAFAYRECRAIDEETEPGSLAHDWGTYVRNMWKVASKLGIPLQSNYPPQFGPKHEGAPANDFVLPPGSVYRKRPPIWIYDDADDRQALSYVRVVGQGEMMQSLADGFAVQIGFTVFRSLYGFGGPRYHVPMPQAGDAALGGHSVYVIGYDRTSSNPPGYPHWLIRNSWGPEAHIREDGSTSPNFTLPFAFHPWINDMWTGRRFEGR